MSTSPIQRFAPFAVCLVLVFISYSLGLHGPLLLDDFHNLELMAVDGGVHQLDDVLRYVFGGGGDNFSRSLARLTFLIDDQYWPVLPSVFKYTNICIHLINGLLIALFLIRLLPLWLDRESAERVALLCAALWLLHPLHVSTTLYVVQRMTQLMLLFSLLSLIFYLAFRQAQTVAVSLVALIAAGVSALLAVAAKESAVILLPFYALIEWYCFSERKSRFQTFSRILSAALTAIFLLVFIKHAIASYPVFETRVFTLWERLQIQGWVLCQYFWYLLVPGAEGMGVYHDDLERQVELAGAGYSGLFWLFHIGIWFIAIRWFRQHKIVIFGLAWFYLAQLIESSVFPLELMYEHRNYVASMGVFLIAAYLLDFLVKRLREKGLPAVGLMVVVAVCGYLAIQLAHRSALWSDHRILIHKWATEHPLSLRAQYSQAVQMDVDGFAPKSQIELKRLEREFDDLSLPLYRILMQCRIDPEMPAEGPLDIQRFAQTNFSSGINTILKWIVDSPNRSCIERHLVNGDLDDLVQAVETMPLMNKKAHRIAQYLDIVDEYYLGKRFYADAVMARERLWKIQPTVDTAMNLAELLIIGQNYKEARIYVDWARQRGEDLWFRDSLTFRRVDHLQGLLDIVDPQE